MKTLTHTRARHSTFFSNDRLRSASYLKAKKISDQRRRRLARVVIDPPSLVIAAAAAAAAVAAAEAAAAAAAAAAPPRLLGSLSPLDPFDPLL